MSSEFSLLSAFLIGLAGGVHCVGMCGGIVGAMRMMLPKGNHTAYHLLYNLGRITSYSLAGFIAGSLGLMATLPVKGALSVLSLVSGLMILALGLYIGQWWRGLTKIEAMGQVIWRRIQPWSKRYIPLKHPFQALPYGAIWGWLPCGLVYSTLTWALASGSPTDGALIMLCFGLGTLPTLLATAVSYHWLVKAFQHRLMGKISGLILILYALFLIYSNLAGMISVG